jgi:hypothetical protein
MFMACINFGTCHDFNVVIRESEQAARCNEPTVPVSTTNYAKRKWMQLLEDSY